MNHMEFDQAYFDAGISRVGTDCEKWDGMIEETGDQDMIPMWVADMDFPSPPAIGKAMEGVLSWGTWGYTISGEKDAEALCAYWVRRHGVQFEPGEVLMSPCVVTGMRVALRALTKEGDGVLINPPVYGPFFQSIKVNNRRVVESPLVRSGDGRFCMNLPEMEEKLASGEAKAVMMCSPHNPVGRCWDEVELAAVVSLCARYDVPLICDEIHADFVYAPNRHHGILSVPGAQARTVMLCAASKTFNVAGLQQSSIVCKNPAMLEAMRSEMEACGVRSGNA
ncbi:MAG: MalY/PatB family protein, partial [Candidatus Ventricola sp.]